MAGCARFALHGGGGGDFLPRIFFLDAKYVFLDFLCNSWESDTFFSKKQLTGTYMCIIFIVGKISMALDFRYFLIENEVSTRKVSLDAIHIFFLA